MKVNGNGRAKVLSHEELQRVFAEFKCPRDRAIFAICLFAGCRISEALGLHTTDIQDQTLTLRKSTTKGKLRTRTIAIRPGLLPFLQEYKPKEAGPLFPGQHGRREHLSRNHVDRIFRDACDRAGIVGASTHSFRRTALTQMCAAGIPLRTVQEISGHNDLGTLQRYLEVTDEQVLAALDVIRL